MGFAGLPQPFRRTSPSSSRASSMREGISDVVQGEVGEELPGDQGRKGRKQSKVEETVSGESTAAKSQYCSSLTRPIFWSTATRSGCGTAGWFPTRPSAHSWGSLFDYARLPSLQGAQEYSTIISRPGGGESPFSMIVRESPRAPKTTSRSRR